MGAERILWLHGGHLGGFRQNPSASECRYRQGDARSELVRLFAYRGSCRGQAFRTSSWPRASATSPLLDEMHCVLYTVRIAGLTIRASFSPLTCECRKKQKQGTLVLPWPTGLSIHFRWFEATSADLSSAQRLVCNGDHGCSRRGDMGVLSPRMCRVAEDVNRFESTANKCAQCHKLAEIVRQLGKPKSRTTARFRAGAFNASDPCCH